MSADQPTRRPRQAEPRPPVPAGNTRLPRRADRRAAGRSRGLGSSRLQSKPRSGDLFFIVLVVLALLKAQLSRAIGLGASNPLMTLAFETAAIVLFLGAVDLIWPRRSYTLDLVAYTALSAIMLANVLYVSFMGQVFSPNLLSVAGQAGEVSDAIAALLRPVYVLYFIDIPILAAWALASRRVRRARPAGRSRPVAVATGVAAVVLGIQVAIVLGIGADVDGSAVARARGFGAYQLGSVARLALPDPAKSTAAAFAHQQGVTPGRAAQMRIDGVRGAATGARIGDVKTGQYRGKNVILIQVEALQDLVIGEKYAGQEITPNLNKLVKQSWYFPNTYSQTSAGNTVDAEFTVNTSLLAPVDGAASLKYADRELPGLPRLLRAQGYDAITLHQNNVRFWNRKELYPALGFRKYWDRSYFGLRDKMWHASDGILFSMGMKVLKSEAASSAPFYAAFITESSHGPWTSIPVDRWAMKLPAADAETRSGRYIGSISYTDGALGEFIADLKRAGIWDDSIIVIYGDHSAQLDHVKEQNDARVTDEILGRKYSDVDRQRVPLIVHLPQQTTANVSEKPVGMVDIMPTIADLLGMDLTSTPHLGRSAFVDAPAFVQTRAYLPSGTFVNDEVIFMPGLSFDDGSAVSITTAEKVAPTDRERQGLARAKQLNLLSEAWIESLPKRAGGHGTKDAIIPGESAP